MVTVVPKEQYLVFRQLHYGASFPLVASIVESSSEDDDDDDDGDEEDNIELSKLSLLLLLLLFGIILSSCVEWNDPVDDDDIIRVADDGDSRVG